jgi:protein-S-isoprenylcysteine O-methyltransferase Ste14
MVARVVVMFTTVIVALWATVGIWIAFELVLIKRDSSRDKGSTDQDQGTRIVNALAVQGAIVLGAVATTAVPQLRMPNYDWITAFGLLVMWSGLAIRVWAVVTLGQAFRTTVEVDEHQTVNADGPYKWVRHPSYSGLILILIGFGIGIGNWLSLAICAFLPTIALIRRIRIEEDEMIRVLGPDYEAYREGTKRLVPGLW